MSVTITRKLAVIYARFSPRPSQKAYVCESIEHQVSRCEAYCLAMDYEVIDAFDDPEVSGAKARRPGLDAALDLCCRRKATLVVYNLKRLIRSSKHAIEIMERLRRAGAGLAIVTTSIDTNTVNGRLVFKILADIDEADRENIGEATSDGMTYLQSTGRLMSDRPPYGTRRGPDREVVLEDGKTVVQRTWEPNPDEIRTLEYMRRLDRGGLSHHAIATRLNSDGLMPRGGVKWWATTIKRMLARDLPLGDADGSAE